MRSPLHSLSFRSASPGRRSSVSFRGLFWLLSLLLLTGAVALGSFGVRRAAAVAPGAAALQRIEALHHYFRPAPAHRAMTAPAGTITGTVFHDYNANGVQDTTSTISNNGAGTTAVAVDKGVAGVQVTAYDSSGAAAGTATTDASGNYSLSVSGSGPYRIEFTGISSDYTPGPAAAGASGSGTTVQFVAGASAANVNLGLVCASQYCADNPVIMTSCYVSGDAVNGAAANDPVIVGFPYNSVGGSPGPPIHPATSKQVGPVFGLAWQRSSGSLFATAFMKRHSGFGPGGTGAIYRVTSVTSATPNVSLFLNLNTLLGAGTTGADPHPSGTDFYRDSASFDAVGKVALGGLKLSEDEQTLYTVNLASRELYRIPIGNPPTAPANAADITRVPVPTTLACTSANDVRPFGLGIYRGQVYVGTVCTAQTSQNASELKAAVYAFNPATNTFAPAPVLQFALNYPRGLADVPRNNPAQWRPWISTFAGNFGSAGCPAPGQGNVCLPVYAQPMLADIAFDRDFMVLAVRDRYGDQTGRFFGGTDLTDNNVYVSISASDLLRAAPAGGGTWTIENNGSAGSVTTAGAGNAQGPGNGEYYFQDNLPGVHDELTMGSVVQVPGFPDVVSTIYDPLGASSEGGVGWFRHADGTVKKTYRIYDASASFGKANGLGGMVALCNPAPLEIGNRVWLDQNSNGIQDAGEPGLAGVQVLLFDLNGDQVGSAVTDANGHYYFNDSNVTGGLQPGTRYRILIDKSQLPLAGTVLTAALVGSNRAIDSDGLMSGNAAIIDMGTGAAGESNHTFDFGFGPQVDLTITNTDNRTTYAPGGKQTYTIVVSNNGPGDVTNATVSVPLPAAIMSATWTCAITAPGSGSVVNACGAASGSGNINTTVTLRNGAAATFTLMVMIDPGASGQLVIPATVTAPPGVVETNLNNNSATDIDTPLPETDLAITKTDNQTTYLPGGSLTYTIVVSNNGPSDVTNATVSDTIPATLTSVAWTCAITAPGSGSVVNACGAASGSGNINTTVTLRNGAAATFTINASISSGASGNLTNTATVTAPPGVLETNLNNNSATDTDTAAPQADLAITKTDNQTTYLPGGSLTYTIVVSNNGPSDVTNATVSDTIPAALTSVAWTCAITAPGSGSVVNACGAASGSGNINTTVTLRNGAAATFTVTASIPSGASGNLVNTATVSAPPGTTDPKLSNNTATDTDTASPQADLAITKSDGQINYTPGDQLIYRITVTNNGPSDVTGAAVTDNLPQGLSAATWTCAITTAGNGTVTNACGAASGNGSINTTVTLRNGASATFTLRVRVSDTAKSAITNIATVSAPPGVTETNSTNNRAIDTDGPIASPIGGGSDDPGDGGSVLIYPLYSSNTSNPGAENTRLNLTNTSPERIVCVHLFFVDGSNCSVSDSFICLTPNQTVTMTASDVDPGVTGYLIAVTVDCLTGCPVNFNHLIGDEYVKLSSGHAANLPAQMVQALTPTANFNCSGNDTTATLRFDNQMYAALPRVVALDSIPSLADGNSMRLVLDRIGGNLGTGLDPVGQVFGIAYSDVENPYSFSFSTGCQLNKPFDNQFPRTNPRLNQIIPAGRVGWMKLWGTEDAALIGAAINFNASAGTNPQFYNQGHSLHTLTRTDKATLRMPVFPPTC
ncbi:MAG: SdrD B-like domain-containing protein [Blastocatellia bacterium]